jgi:hypothetical protein
MFCVTGLSSVVVLCDAVFLRCEKVGNYEKKIVRIL